MSDFKITDGLMQSAPQVGKTIELVTMPDGDQIAFWSDVFPNDPAASMKLAFGGDSAGDSVDTDKLMFNGSDSTVLAGERCLVFCRASGGSIISPIRWVGHIPDPTAIKIKPLREVFNPRVTYDAGKNKLSLWFWTNIKLSVNPPDPTADPTNTNTTYKEDDLVVQGATSSSSAKRVLCFATGKFVHGKINSGGYLKDLADDANYGFYYNQSGIQDYGYDLIPIFELPKYVYGKTDSLSYGSVSDFGGGGGLFGNFLCSLSGSSTVNVSGGNIIFHGVAPAYQVPAATVSLSGSPDWVFAYVTADGSSYGVDHMASFPTSDTNMYRFPLAQYVLSGSGYKMNQLCHMFDIHALNPIR